MNPVLSISCLSRLSRHGIDMTRLESRPSHSGIWSYRFFIDFKGHVDDAPIQNFLDDVRAQSAGENIGFISTSCFMKQLAIIGLGLIGASVVQPLKKACARLAYRRSLEN